MLFSAMHWIMSKEPAPGETCPVPVVEELLLSKEFFESPSPISFLRAKLILSPQEIIAAAKATSGQRNNALWAAARKLRITASNFSKVLTAIRLGRFVIVLKLISSTIQMV